MSPQEKWHFDKLGPDDQAPPSTGESVCPECGGSAKRDRGECPNCGASDASRLRSDPHHGAPRAIPRWDRRGYILRRFLLISDLAALGTAFAVMLVANAAVGRPVFVAGDLAAFIALLPLWVLLASLLGFYHLSERRIDHSFADEFVTTFVVMTLWSWFWLIGRTAIETGSVAVLGSIVLWAAGILTVAVFRSLLHGRVHKRHWYRQSVVLVGPSEDVGRVMRRLNRHPEYALDVVGALHMDGDTVREEFYLAKGEARVAEYALSATGHSQSADSHGQSANGYAQSANGEGASARHRRQLLDRVVATASASNATRVIVTGWAVELSERTELIQVLLDAGVQVDLVSGEPEALLSTGALHHLEGLPILTVSPAQITRPRKLIKRALDASIAALSLAFLSPLLAYIAIRIKLDSPGPILFRQERVGREGELFQVLKFRTMVADAEERKRELDSLNIHAGQHKAMFKVPNDPRITRFGAWLRRWSLDELPQLWNVLSGAMSIVGPRPLIPEEAELVSDWHAERNRVRPGITGPWQVLGRSEIPFEDMISLDYMYVSTWTLREDARILLRTLGAITRARGAY
jgi:exopolysaccharide biosynthesis polyprenyl glycosylphosphotransferase